MTTSPEPAANRLHAGFIPPVALDFGSETEDLPDIVGYGDPMGCGPFREAVAEHPGTFAR